MTYTELCKNASVGIIPRAIKKFHRAVNSIPIVSLDMKGIPRLRPSINTKMMCDLHNLRHIKSYQRRVKGWNAVYNSLPGSAFKDVAEASNIDMARRKKNIDVRSNELYNLKRQGRIRTAMAAGGIVAATALPPSIALLASSMQEPVEGV